MRIDIVLLTFAYVLSQFYRSFLAVLSEVLERDVGASSADLAEALGLWFLTFAAMQIPVGWALDQIGPRRTSAVLLLIGGGGGAAVFAMAGGPGMITVAMMLIAVGCSPVLMASYYIFARVYPVAMFATLAAVLLGTGSLGNLLGARPLAMAVEAIGWRESLWVLAGVTAVTAVGLWFLVRDPERVEGAQNGSILDLLRLPAMWLILPLMFVQYAPAAGMRGLWIGPYLSDVFGMDTAALGNASLIMAVAMIAGTFVYGPLDRWLGTRKWVIAPGAFISALACLGLGLLPAESAAYAVALFAGVGFFGACFPLLIAHGRSFFPSHLVGRGVTLMNLFGIGGVGIMQFATGRLFGAFGGETAGAAAYQGIFVFFGLLVLVGLVPYLWSQDRTD